MALWAADGYYTGYLSGSNVVVTSSFTSDSKFVLELDSDNQMNVGDTADWNYMESTYLGYTAAGHAVLDNGGIIYVVVRAHPGSSASC
jgi:hypothetical protein